MKNGFHWYSGVVDVATTCPAVFGREPGLLPFFEGPNEEQWGRELPRWLYHECLHFWQVASSRYLQEMIAAEWQRLLDFERDGTVRPVTERRQAFGRQAEPFSVNDLVECLARFWDIHTRGPHRLLEEAGERVTRDERGYSAEQMEAAIGAAMASGPNPERYTRPYHWMRDHAEASPTVQALPGQLKISASWAVNLLLPMAGFLALNTEDPVKAFLIAFERGLDPDCIGIAASRRDPRQMINLDWLDFWPVITKGLARTLGRHGLAPRMDSLIFTQSELRDHPVYRLVGTRFDALQQAMKNVRTNRLFNPPRNDGTKAEAALLREINLQSEGPWPIFTFPGHPNYRLMLAACFTPALVRFTDVAVPASRTGGSAFPWPVDEAALVDAANEADRRTAAFLRADDAARRKLPLAALQP